ncbi:PRC-barrel domain-containing protein [Candidatus Bathyarchaeota archaeon]|jgi:sporulation protein YlmC with PRC-barrel domain|nr:PRC-barrel domain-containing protein [Candidatus Bathyarchaeota archaeon]
MRKYEIMAKQSKEKSITKDKLIGMKVIDSKGSIVGTVTDIGFTVGKAGTSLIIEDKDGETREVSWESEVQGAGDFVLLKPQAATPTAVAPQQQGAPVCPTCGGPLTYIQQYQKWYCYKDQKYV